MANTVTQTTLDGTATDTYVRRLIHIQSDGTEETDLVIYDNSAFVADTSAGELMWVRAWGSACTLIFEWDQDTDYEICKLNPSHNANHKHCTGGLRRSNPGDTGATGDLVLTTANLDANDVVTIEICVKQK